MYADVNALAEVIHSSAGPLWLYEVSRRDWPLVCTSLGRLADWLCVEVTDAFGSLSHFVVISPAALRTCEGRRLTPDRAAEAARTWLRCRRPEEIEASPTWHDLLFPAAAVAG